MNATATKYEVCQLGSDSWRPATEQEIAVALRSGRYTEWKDNRPTGNWSTLLGIGRDVRNFRCTVCA
jgi:hypothetical protein